MATIEIGHIEAIYRYPVKSMRGEALDAAMLGFHGIDGDRRLALRRLDERGGFPWLTAGKLPALVHFTPERQARGAKQGSGADAAAVADGDGLPTHVRTPEGALLPLFGDELAADIARRHGASVQMTHLKHGIFDDASLSVITSRTIGEICGLAGRDADVRRFRPNVLVRSTSGVPFEEDAWVGGVLTFGDGEDAPAIAVTMRDVRCAMINIDPDGPGTSPDVLKAAVRANQNNAGIYATITRAGRLAVGQPIRLHR